MSSSACHLLALVNATYYLTGKFIDPIWLKDYAINKGYRYTDGIDMYGLYNDISKNYGTKYNIKLVGYTKGTDRFERLKRHIINGGVAIGGGEGHVTAVVAYDSSTDKYLVLDSCPSSTYKSTNGYRWLKASEMKTGSGWFAKNYMYFFSKR